MATMDCPRCEGPLDRTPGRPGLFWRCRDCGGQAATVSVLRRHVPDDVLAAMLRAGAADPTPGERRCPSCAQPMRVLVDRGDDREQELDFCSGCQFVWCDPGEYEALPGIPPPEPEPRLSPAAARAVAMEQLRVLRERHAEGAIDTNADSWQQWIRGLLGLPVIDHPEDDPPHAWATWALLATFVLLTLVTLGEHYAKPSFTFSYCFFAAYFLVVVGRFLEGACGGAAISAENVDRVIGGAGAGVTALTFYFVALFPRTWVSLLLGWGVALRWLRLPAVAFLAMWGLLLLLATWDAVRWGLHPPMVEWIGLAVGVLFWLWDRRVSRPRAE